MKKDESSLSLAKNQPESWKQRWFASSFPSKYFGLKIRSDVGSSELFGSKRLVVPKPFPSKKLRYWSVLVWLSLWMTFDSKVLNPKFWTSKFEILKDHSGWSFALSLHDLQVAIFKPSNRTVQRIAVIVSDNAISHSAVVWWRKSLMSVHFVIWKKEATYKTARHFHCFDQTWTRNANLTITF